MAVTAERATVAGQDWARAAWRRVFGYAFTLLIVLTQLAWLVALGYGLYLLHGR